MQDTVVCIYFFKKISYVAKRPRKNSMLKILRPKISHIQNSVLPKNRSVSIRNYFNLFFQVHELDHSNAISAVKFTCELLGDDIALPKNEVNHCF